MTLNEPHLILGIGELLWDMLPRGPRLGGAPANFAVMAGRLGNHAAILSRTGRDELGRKAVELLEPLPVDVLDALQDIYDTQIREHVQSCFPEIPLVHGDPSLGVVSGLAVAASEADPG